MPIKNSRGMTLVELLAALSIGFVLMGLVSSIMMQSFKNANGADSHINLRQEANIIIALFNQAHLSPVSTGASYTVSLKRLSTDEWELLVNNQSFTSRNYEIRLELQSGTSTTQIFDSLNNLYPVAPPFDKKQPLTVQKILLIDKKDNARRFEMSTIISRM